MDPFLNAVVVTVSDRLLVRSEPRVSDDSIMYKPVLPLGTELRTLDGPVRASGYTWYKVEPVSFSGLDGPGFGWVAMAGRDGEPWIALAPGTTAPAHHFWGKPVRMTGLAGMYQPRFVHWAHGFALLPISGMEGFEFRYSSDAREWKVAQSPVNGDETVTIRDLVAWDEGLVAVGGQGIIGGDGTTVDSRAIVLTSSDGRRWQRVSDPSFEHADMSLVGIGPEGIVALGSHSWTSSDGRAWVRVSGATGRVVGRDASTLVASEDRLTAFVTVPSPTNRSLRVDVWQTDGLTWTKVGQLPGSNGAIVRQAAYGDGRWLALGQRSTETDSVSLAWTSVDGIHWNRGGYPGLGDVGEVADLTRYPGGFVAVSWSGGPGGACGTDSPYTSTTWTSPDGLAWNESLLDGSGVFAMVGLDDSIVGIGQSDNLALIRLTAALPSSLPPPPMEPMPTPTASPGSAGGGGCGP